MRSCCSAFTSAHDGWSRSTTADRSPLSGGTSCWWSAASSGSGSTRWGKVEFLGDGAGSEQPANMGEVWVAPPDLADEFVGQVIDLPGCFLAERGEDALRVADRGVLARQPSRPVPLGDHAVPVHAHAAFPASAWPSLSTVTLVMSWLTLRRDRPNRSAMARWLSGAPAATDAA
jgi:hypothetical protein